MIRSIGSVLACCFCFGVCLAQEAPPTVAVRWDFERVEDRTVAAVGGAPACRLMGASRVGAPERGALAFSGRDRAVVQDAPAGFLNLGGNGDLSLSLWVAVPSPPRRDEYTILSKGDRGNNPRLLLKVDAAGRVMLRLGAGPNVTTVEGATAMADGRWHHILAVLDRDRQTALYLDGMRDGTGPATAAVAYRTASPLTLGASHQKGTEPRRFLLGVLDDVRIFRHALTADMAVQLAAEAGPRAGLPAAFPAPRAPATGTGRTTARRRRAVGKKTHPGAISDIVDGKARQVIAAFGPRANGDAADAESMFVMAAAHTVEGELDAAVAYVRRAVAAGLPVERFLAGPRNLLGPLLDSQAFRELADATAESLVHGPMLGVLTPTSVRIWVRTAREQTVQVTAVPVDGGAGRRVEDRTSRQQDGTVVLELTGLSPQTTYDYTLAIDGEAVAHSWQFRTPAGIRGGQQRLVFGGGAGYNPQFEHMWTTIASAEPDALVLLGDNVYIDNPTRSDVQRYCYYRRQSRPEFRALVSRVPVYAIWDDHDFTTNDQRGGPEIEKPGWKRPVYRLFRSQWNNPGYAQGDAVPGCWFHTTLGDVDLIMLDGRCYREDPRSPPASMLGPVQKAWLFRTLKACRGTFILLASPVPWSKGTKPGSLDTWDGHPEEREEIFRFLADKRIEGVLLLSADRHRSDLWRIDRPDAYPLYEFESSRLTNVHRHGPMKGALFSYNETCSFGRLDIDTARPNPTVTYTIVTIDGKPVFTHAVPRSDLRFAAD